MKKILIGLTLFFSLPLLGQERIQFDGQLSLFGSYAPDNRLDLFLGARYIPELEYGFAIDSTKRIDFMGSANISASSIFHPFDDSNLNADVQPYRLWARYTSKQFEFRLGLQKIDFGVATLLRPIQWFNQIDPRDPLSLTNGVYGALARYYFLNNANIWVWALYGNEKTRGFDAIETNQKAPEYGGRFQLPTERGEIAFSFHHRSASTKRQPLFPTYENIPENRIGIDGKWDLTVGLWFEAVLSRKEKDLGILTNQSLLNIGTDYTFGLGNGLNVIFEHLLSSTDKEMLAFDQVTNISAMTIAYPMGFFDNISSIFLYNWTAKNTTVSINYEHQFKNLSGYLIAFYNPKAPSGIQQNELVDHFAGPGFRIMLVYNH